MDCSTPSVHRAECQWHRGASDVSTLFPPNIGVTYAVAKLCSPSPLLSPISDDTALAIRLILPTPHALFHQARLPRLKSPSLFLTPFPPHVLDLSCTIPTLPDKCTSGSSFCTSNADQIEPRCYPEPLAAPRVIDRWSLVSYAVQSNILFRHHLFWR